MDIIKMLSTTNSRWPLAKLPVQLQGLTVLMLTLMMISLSRSSEHHDYRSSHLNANEYSSIMNQVLKNYDKRVIPVKDKGVVNVTMQIFINDMVPVTAAHMHYSMDMYFRQIWTDYRLAFGNISGASVGNHSLALDAQFADVIWLPDTYFPYGKKGTLHVITRPNKMLRLTPDGTVFYSQRLTITAFCPMDLFKFPFDKQTCNFSIESYAYDSELVRLGWDMDGGGPIFTWNNDMPLMFEFTVKNISYFKTFAQYSLLGSYDQASVTFVFTRNITYYVLQMFLPLGLIVILSWVGFWIDYRSTPARVSLGITTVLTMTTLSNSIKNSLPTVRYMKAIDIYVLVCIVYVFCALVEYTIVGITDMIWRKKFKQEKQEEEIKEKIINRWKRVSHSAMFSRKRSKHSQQENFQMSNNGNITDPSDGEINHAFETIPEIPTPSPQLQVNGNGIETHSTDLRRNSSFGRRRKVVIANDEVTNSQLNRDMLDQQYKKAVKRRRGLASIRRRGERVGQKLREKHRVSNEVHVIDKISRYLFPLSFLLFNALFFLVYLLKV